MTKPHNWKTKIFVTAQSVKAVLYPREYCVQNLDDAKEWMDDGR
jgi:hypothetical protein